jgi:hypothetical protein
MEAYRKWRIGLFAMWIVLSICTLAAVFMLLILRIS